MSAERIFAQAQHQSELDAAEVSREWSDKIDAELLAVFTALDAMGEPAKASVIAESVLSEFDCFPPAADDMEPLWLSEQAAEVLRCINAFEAAHRAEKCARDAARKARLALDLGEAA